jgi:hypothetical protein
VESTDFGASDLDRTLDLPHVDTFVFLQFAVDKLSSVHLVQIFEPELGLRRTMALAIRLELLSTSMRQLKIAGIFSWKSAER